MEGHSRNICRTQDANPDGVGDLRRDGEPAEDLVRAV